MPCFCDNGNCNCFIQAGDGIIITGNGLAGDPWIIASDGTGGGAGGGTVDLQGNPADVAPTCENRLRYNTSGDLTFLPDGVEYVTDDDLDITSIGIDVPVANSSTTLYQQDFTNNGSCDLYVTVFNNVDLSLTATLYGSDSPALHYNAGLIAGITNPANEIGGLSEWIESDVLAWAEDDSSETIFLDTNFGTDGVSIISTWTAGRPWNAVITSTDAVIAAVRESGSIGNAQGVARLTTTGALDATWAGDGFFETAQGNGDVITDSSNRPVVIGGIGSAQFRRFTGAGTLDGTFGVAGLQVVSIGGESFHGDTIEQQFDGKYLGFGQNGTTTKLLGARLTTAGALDGTYGTAGVIQITTPTTGDNVRSDIDSTDRPVILTTTTNIVRLDTVGALDAGWGAGGVLDISSEMSAYNISVDAADRVVAVGDDTAPIVARYDSSGVLDPTFGFGGVTDQAFFSEIGAGSARIRGVDHLSSGKIVVAGTSTLTNDVLVAILNSNGTLDTSFYGTGCVAVDIGDVAQPIVYDVAARGNGDIVVVGEQSSLTDAFFIRFSPTTNSDPAQAIVSHDIRSTFLLPAGVTETYMLTTNTYILDNSTGLVVDGNNLTHTAHVKYEPVRVGGFDVGLA